jgi:ubiquitin-activating enzyme E1
MKSEAAAKAVKAMNPAANVTAHQNRVGPETESILNLLQLTDIYFGCY